MKKILLILLSIFFLSCGVKNSNDNEHIFYLDNPSNEDIEIILDSNKNITTINSIENIKVDKKSTYASRCFFIYSLITINYLLILLIIQSKIQAPTTDTKIL